MSEEFNLRSKEYWRRMGWGLLFGLLGALGAMIFIGLVDAGTDLVWPTKPGWEPFSGSWMIVVIMTIAGLIAGIIHHFTPAAELDVFGAVNEGRLDPKPVPSSLLTSLVSLIGGFSLGPEVPVGMFSAGFATWLSNRRGEDEQTTRTNVLSSVSGAYAGLFSSPFAMIAMLLESVHMQSPLYYGTLFIAGLAAAIGFSLFYWVGGDTFSSLLGLVEPQAYDLRVWHIAMGIVFGVLALPVALIFGIFMKIMQRLVAPLNKQPIIRGVVGGLLLGLLGKALPITLFLGTDGLSETTQDAAEIGVALLILFAFAKLIALGGALSFGFIGGPIFPLLFSGATLGAAINLAFPEIPMGLAVGGMMAAVPAVLVPIPIALAIIVALVVGLSPMNTLPVIMASLTAFSLARGLGFGGDNQKAADSSKSA